MSLRSRITNLLTQADKAREAAEPRGYDIFAHIDAIMSALRDGQPMPPHPLYGARPPEAEAKHARKLAELAEAGVFRRAANRETSGHPDIDPSDDP